MRTTSGLNDELEGGMTLAEAEALCLAYVREHCPEPGKAPLAGNSVGTDRTFLDRDVPEFANWLSYRDRKSTRLNSSHVAISYAVFCLKKKTSERTQID